MSETSGQPNEGTPQGTTQDGTEGGTTNVETTGNNGTQTAEETFFDPESIKGKPELEAAYKQMQRAFTEKTGVVKSQRQKIDAYDQFMSNPKAVLQQLANQYGLTLAEAKQVVEGQQTYEPKTWEDVFSKAEERAEQRVLDKLQPFFSEVKEVKKANIEKLLDEKCPDWRLHEDKMSETLQAHPSLVNDPVSLYRLSIPEEVLLSRATKEALKKIESKSKGASVSPGSNTNKSGNYAPNGPLSFQEAVVAAKARLTEQGIRGPNH